MELYQCSCGSALVMPLRLWVSKLASVTKKSFGRNFFNALAHQIPTAAMACPIVVIRVPVRMAVAKNDYCIFVCDGRSQKGDAFEPSPKNPTAVAGVWACWLCSITTRLPTDFERMLHANLEQNCIFATLLQRRVSRQLICIDLHRFSSILPIFIEFHGFPLIFMEVRRFS